MVLLNTLSNSFCYLRPFLTFWVLGSGFSVFSEVDFWKSEDMRNLKKQDSEFISLGMALLWFCLSLTNGVLFFTLIIPISLLFLFFPFSPFQDIINSSGTLHNFNFNFKWWVHQSVCYCCCMQSQFIRYRYVLCQSGTIWEAFGAVQNDAGTCSDLVWCAVV